MLDLDKSGVIPMNCAVARKLQIKTVLDTVLIFHKNNISSIYKHNHSSSVEKGDFVKSGQIIALSGNTGENTTGPHLHLEIWDDKGPINPEDLITF